MLRGGWVRNLAIGFVAAAIIAIVSWLVWETLSRYQTEQTNQQNDVAEYQSDGAERERYGACKTLPTFIDKFACLAGEVATSREQKEAEYDLIAQQDMAAWALGVLLFSIASFVVSTVGVAVIVWTFREQKKLTQDQSCAVVELIDATISCYGSQSFDLDLALLNSGTTAASEIKIEGTMIVWPGLTDQGVMLGVERKTTFATDPIATLGGSGGDAVVHYCGGPPDFSGVLQPPQGTGGYIHAQERGHPELIFEGAITYRDIFRRKHKVPFRLSTLYVEGRGLPERLAGVSRGRTSAPYFGYQKEAEDDCRPPEPPQCPQWASRLTKPDHLRPRRKLAER